MELLFIDRYYDCLDVKYRKGLLDWDKVSKLANKLMEWDDNNRMKRGFKNV